MCRKCRRPIDRRSYRGLSPDDWTLLYASRRLYPNLCDLCGPDLLESIVWNIVTRRYLTPENPYGQPRAEPLDPDTWPFMRVQRLV